jgi:hypothetical protein
MTIVSVKAMSAPEAAVYLRQQLGPLVSWETYLADLRRGRAHRLADFDLQPCGTLRDRCRRPLYAIRDLAEFVLSVRRRNPAAKAGIKPQICAVDIDLDDPRSWKMRPPAPLTIAT